MQDKTCNERAEVRGALEKYLDLHKALEVLWAAGMGESLAAEVIRDASDLPWRQMSAADKTEFRNRASDERKPTMAP